MAYKRIERKIPASVWKVTRLGTRGISIQMSHSHRGPKHSTHYVDTFELDFCDMRRMGERFHEIMDELSTEWHSTKKAISGE